LSYPYPASTVFSGPFTTEAGAAKAMAVKSNGNGNGNGRIDTLGDVLETLFILDYRYARFVLDSKTGLFSMVKYVQTILSVVV